MSGEPDNKDPNVLVDKINETLKGDASETDKLNAINTTITQDRLKNMDTPEMFRTVITRLDGIETRLQKVEPSDPKGGGETLGDKGQDKEGSSGQPPKENPKMPDDKTKDDKPKDDKTKGKPKDPDVPKTPGKPEDPDPKDPDPKDPDPKDPDPKDPDKTGEPIVIKGDTAGITPQRVEIIVSQAPAPPTTPPPTAPVTTPTTPPATTPTEPPTTPAPPTTPPPATTPAPPEDPEKPPVLEEDFKASALMIKAWRPDIKPVERNLLREKKEE